MLGSPTPATATLSTTTTPASPTRPSRLRGLSYLRNYTHNHLHSQRSETPPLTRSTSSPAFADVTAVSREPSRALERTAQNENAAPSIIQSREHGWVPTVQGRSGLSREAALTSTSTDPASPEPSSSAMTRSRSSTTNGPVPKSPATAAMRRQSTAGVASTADSTADTPSESSTNVTAAKEPLPTIRFIPHTERSTRPSLTFSALSRTLKTPNSIVRVGRYSERDNAASDPSTTILPVGFKSKVVSRRHCELWCTSGQWYIKDVKSSSGTFLNHVRLSPPGQESRPFPVNDGDVVQLGIDFKGGEEVIFRCVKIRIECNRGWQKSLNSFNTTTHKRLRNLTKTSRDSDAQSTHSSECSICLNPVAPCQALFVAPCSHVWHYKCVRNLIHSNWPNFLCPNCRFVADLDADVEPPEEEQEFEEVDEEMSGENGVELNLQEEEGKSGEIPRDDERHENEPSERDSSRLNAATSDDELAGHLHSTSLHPPRSARSRSRSPAPRSPSHSGATTPTQPRNIAPSVRQEDTHRSNDLLGARSTTPTSTAQFALAAGVINEGPMTPRNDAGPFVFDGSAGRDRIDGIATMRVDEESEEGED